MFFGKIIEISFSNEIVNIDIIDFKNLTELRLCNARYRWGKKREFLLF